MKRKLLIIKSIFKKLSEWVLAIILAVALGVILALVLRWLGSIVYDLIVKFKSSTVEIAAEDTEGRMADASEFDTIGVCDEYGMIVVTKDGKDGLIKNGGLVIIEPKYDYISSFTHKNGIRVFSDGGLYGILDKEGNIIVEPKYEDILIHDYDKKIVVREGLTYKVYDWKDIIN